jgi:hypothetical protein
VARKRSGRRRGRPINPHARRRKTTRRGRRGLPELVDPGAPLLLERRRAITGRSDIELVDYPGILLANGFIDADELDTLRRVEGWLSLARRGRGISDGHVGRLWAQILAGTRGGRTPTAGGRTGHTAADSAWARLLELRAAFAEFDLVAALEEVVAVAGGERAPRSRVELAALKAGCAGIAAYLHHGRRRGRGYARPAVC